MTAQQHPAPIEGTHLFDGIAAAKGFELNAMCYSFNEAANRAAFLADEDAYCARFNLTSDQREAVAKRDVLGMIAAGGNIYYLAKLAGIFGLNVQDVGALQTGKSVPEFKQFLLDQAQQIKQLEATHG
ncbi:protocatechuate 4,5-dioxygenase subunit alpha [Novosphingobium umbonatum]|uniref:Protocatechuate 4,5-dioxygenase subunit alpha n=1 Tax=Novosphingobium umbonatum TaxID=1908524 RepID=A0A437NAZ4_9SPHN|nr:protocatechuate 4,5-dioxygenase subunit alpha [Novosphingobium umbonatum]RVU07100.1 protocatechuate 4,5-dioxygenase subunit alpha [Novosphingobium umbonatum]